ncbi:methylenetetrahydrofolate reductase [Tropicimonas sp. TH_r6]|uniref:methylenetetrahydrofolate reductase n=1 Tax=Tropicimonas sp. TH_r6 TaxID=3082085 RepID=UPI002953E7E0|nr:methylenetetrahydrofolate reductase [Tropicimonas sp. TH_r6]MDV7145522.1 methylenetetrahydrofolate reductase [Tropicimonas sp. TH_r6]
MALLPFRKRSATPDCKAAMESFLQSFSIEVMPRTAAKVEDFRTLLPQGTRVYIAHIEGTPIEEMVATAKRLTAEGFPVMPHFPARIIKDKATLADWIARYQGEADVKQGLILAGGVDAPRGDFDSSMALLETGLFEDAGFTHLHVAGHPEGNRDIDPAGSTRRVMDALHWKQAYARDSNAEMAIATQFAFESKPVIAWADAIREAGIELPIHIGIAGPAKLQTMIKFAVACGVGASMRVLQRRARDVTKLVMPFEPNEILYELAVHKATNPEFNISRVHFFPLGGIKATAGWTAEHGGAQARAAAATG